MTVATVAPAVAAPTEAEPVRVDVRTNGRCRAAESFFDQVRRRTSLVRLARPEERARTLLVRVAEEGDRYEGSVALSDTGFESSPRVLRGDSCEELVAGLALVAALSIDPHAVTTPLPVAPAERPPPSLPPERSNTADRRALEWAFGLGLDGRSGGDIPVVASGSLFVDLGLKSREGVGPNARLAVLRSLEHAVDNGAAAAEFRWTSGELQLCPWEFRVAGALSFAPCGALAVGILDAKGTRATILTSETRLWGATSVVGRLRWDLTRHTFLEGSGGLTAVLTRDTFYFLPDVPVYEPGWLSFRAAFGGGIRL